MIQLFDTLPVPRILKFLRAIIWKKKRQIINKAAAIYGKDGNNSR